MGEITLCSFIVKSVKGCVFVTPRPLQSLFAGGYNINDVMFYWTRGNESVSGLDTLQLAQYTVEDHYTSVSEAVYETGKVQSLLSDCSGLFCPCFNPSQSTLFSKVITRSWSSISSWRGAFCTSSWRLMSPPVCWLYCPGFPSGSRCPLFQHGFASVWTEKYTYFLFSLTKWRPFIQTDWKGDKAQENSAKLNFACLYLKWQVFNFSCTSSECAHESLDHNSYQWSSSTASLL